MTKRVLDVGNCAADHGAIRRLVETHFDAEVVQAHDAKDSMEQLRDAAFDLVLINRRLDLNQSEGLNVLKRIKRDEKLASLPVMLITNFAEHQQAAVVQGAEPGFGKAELDSPVTFDKLRRVLGPTVGS